MTPADLKGIDGGHWAFGRIEVQACAADQPALIATVACDSYAEAEAAVQNLIERRSDLVMLRIVLNGDVVGARHFIGHRAA